jgi:hypothetical protein
MQAEAQQVALLDDLRTMFGAPTGCPRRNVVDWSEVGVLHPGAPPVTERGD